MPTYKIVLAFNMDKQGWTETYYRNADTAEAAAFFGGPVQDGRFMIPRNNQVELFAIRASNVNGSRESFVRYPQITASGTGRGPAAPPAPNRDQGTTCVLMRLYFAAQSTPPAFPVRNRGLWLRGCPDDWLDWNAAGQAVIGGDILAAINAYKRHLILLEMRGRVNPPKTVNLPTLVISLTPNPNNRNQTIVSAPGLDPAIVNGSRVLFGMVPKRDLPYLNGTYPVFGVVAGTSFQINYRMLQTGFSPESMYVRNTTPQYPLITDAIPEDFRSHKTGRPTERYVGRRSGVRSSH